MENGFSVSFRILRNFRAQRKKTFVITIPGTIFDLKASKPAKHGHGEVSYKIRTNSGKNSDSEAMNPGGDQKSSNLETCYQKSLLRFFLWYYSLWNINFLILIEPKMMMMMMGLLSFWQFKKCDSKFWTIPTWEMRTALFQSFFVQLWNNYEELIWKLIQNAQLMVMTNFLWKMDTSWLKNGSLYPFCLAFYWKKY